VVYDEEERDERGEGEEDERAGRTEHLLHPPREAEADVAAEECERRAPTVGEPPDERREEQRRDDGESSEQGEENRRATAEEDVPPRAEDEREQDDRVAEEVRDQPVRDRRADEPERVMGLVAARIERVAE